MVVALIWLLLLLIGMLAITAATNELAARWVGREFGCLVGGIAACAWVWMLVQIDHVSAPVYLLAMIGVPVAIVAAVRGVRPDQP